MPVMIGADIAPAGRKLSRYPDGSLNPLLSAEFASSSQVLIDPLPDQVGDRSPARCRRLPESFQLPVRQLYLGSNHAHMLAEMPSCFPIWRWRLVRRLLSWLEVLPVTTARKKCSGVESADVWRPSGPNHKGPRAPVPPRRTHALRAATSVKTVLAVAGGEGGAKVSPRSGPGNCGLSVTVILADSCES
jgi:hypothetical protein